VETPTAANQGTGRGQQFTERIVLWNFERRGEYVPSMHRRRSSDGRRSGIYGRNAGGVHRQIQAIFQLE
jgi:hypothetical protein